MENYVGKRLDGRYELKEILGIGGMAVVYKAYDNVEDRIVAVKILKDEYISNEDFVRRFKNESRAISLLSHPNIVKVYDVSFGATLQYIVMEYIDGITLKEYIEKNGSVVWKNAVYFMVQILRALQHAHDKGIIHRDVKPQNIILLNDGTIKVTDFGIARFARTEAQTITDKAIGSVHYISPEQARCDLTDERSDLYSVGVILYEMLTGQLPFEAESAVSVAIMQLQSKPKLPTEINTAIPKGLEQIAIHAMQKKPDKRYNSAAEMLKDLEDFKRDPEILFDYDVYVDDMPTKFVDLENGDNEKQTPEKSKNSTLMVLAGVAAAFVLAMVILAIVIGPKLFKGSGEEIACPLFVGTAYSDIENNPEYDDLLFEVTYENSVEYEEGVVMEQKPAKGRKIKKTQKIKLVVSLGVKSVNVPDVYGYEEADAIKTLKEKGFEVTTITKEDEEVEAGFVISTNPPRNESVPEGSSIEIHVSLGEATKYVSTPNLIGYDLETAKKKIEEAGLTVGSVKTVDSSMPEDTVVKQSPDPVETKEVEKGTAINLEISSGSSEKSYEVSLKIPSDISQNVVITAYLDGAKCYDSGVLENLGRNYSFVVTSEKNKGELVVKMQNPQTDESAVTYIILSIDFAKGTSTVSDNPGNYPTNAVNE